MNENQKGDKCTFQYKNILLLLNKCRCLCLIVIPGFELDERTKDALGIMHRTVPF